MAEDKSVSKEKTKANYTKMKGKIGSKTTKFFKETFVELKKVVWPTKRQVGVNTVIVIIASILMALFIQFFDVIFDYIDSALLRR